jgi:hypothetical protein
MVLMNSPDYSERPFDLGRLAASIQGNDPGQYRFRISIVSER